MKTVNIAEKFAKFEDQWNPKIVGEVNDFYVKAVKLQGKFIWHHHDYEDELFLVIKGVLHMKLRDPSGAEREEVIRAGEFLIVPHGTEHLPYAQEETHILLLEPKSTLNTGNLRNQRTVPHLQSI